MRMIRNVGIDRVIDLLRPEPQNGARLNAVMSPFSLFALDALIDGGRRLPSLRLIHPEDIPDIEIQGSGRDRA